MKKRLLLLCLLMTITSTAAAAPLTNFADERNAVDFGFWHTKMDQSNVGKTPGPGVDPGPGPGVDPGPGPGVDPGPGPGVDPGPGPGVDPGPGPGVNPGPGPGKNPCPPISYRPSLRITPAMYPYAVLGMADEGYSTRNNFYGAVTLGLNDKLGVQFRYFDVKSPQADAAKQYGRNMEYNLIYSLQKNVAMFAGVNQYKLADTTTNAMSAGLIAKAPVSKHVKVYGIAGIGQHSLRHLEVGFAANMGKDLDLNVGYRVFQGIDKNDTVKAKYNGVIVGVTQRFGHVAKKTVIEEVVPVPPVVTVPEIPAPEIPVEKIILNNVNFDFDKASLRSEAYPALNHVVEVAKENPTWQFFFTGHTDGIGSDDYNMDLSQRRVTTVKNYIVTNGVSEERIAVDWKGKREPVATNDTAEGRAQNRRVELVIE